MYSTILSNLETIQLGNDFDDEAKSVAKGLHSKLTDMRFYATLLFMIDVLKVLSISSKRLQRNPSSGGIVIGLEADRKNLLDSLESFRQWDGLEIRYFLMNSKCQKFPPEWKRCSTSDLDSQNFMLDGDGDNEPIVFRQRTGRHESNLMKLSELRPTFIDTISQKINEYFPEGSMKMFDVLSPNALPKSVGEVPVYSSEIMPLAKRFGINQLQCANDFTEFLTDLLLSNPETLCEKLQLNAKDFWIYYMEQGMINMGDTLQRLLKIVITLPVSSAEAERGFSIMKHIKYDRRNRLSPSHLNDMMRIRINGPPINEWNPKKYVTNWLKQHKKTDTSVQPSRTIIVTKSSNIF